MKGKKEKKKNARYALKYVKPISPVIIIKAVRSGFGGDYNSINRMKKKRQENPENFDKQQVRQMMNVGHVVFKNLLAAHRRRVSIHMHEKINAERCDAGYLMQFPQKKSSADFNSHNEFSILNFRLAIYILKF